MLNLTQLLRAYLIATNLGLRASHNQPDNTNKTDIITIIGEENESCMINVNKNDNLERFANMDRLGKLTLDEHSQLESSCDSC